jgi:hypothetical protein
LNNYFNIPVYFPNWCKWEICCNDQIIIRLFIIENSKTIFIN